MASERFDERIRRLEDRVIRIENRLGIEGVEPEKMTPAAPPPVPPVESELAAARADAGADPGAREPQPDARPGEAGSPAPADHGDPDLAEPVFAPAEFTQIEDETAAAHAAVGDSITDEPVEDASDSTGSRSGAFRRLFQPSFESAAPRERAAAVDRPDIPPSRDAADGTERAPSWEMLIGARWMAWVGAIVVVIAVGFFVKLAVDQGWWGALPKEARCAMAAGLGMLLIASGEVALRKVGRPAAVGLFGAGLGTLYLTAYAGSRYFQLFSDQTAFVLMAVVAFLGFGVTTRGRMLAIGVLSVLGGYLTPILLPAESTVPFIFPLYLTMLLGVSLGLSAALPKPFAPLRFVAILAHFLMAVAWAMTERGDHPALVLSFMTLWWAAVNAEALLAARRERSPSANAFASILATAWYVAVSCIVINGAQAAGQNWLGLFTAGVAVLATAAALFAASGLDALRQPPVRAIDKFAVTLWGQAGVLAAVAIALHFNDYGRNDYGQTIGWLAMGLACVEVGRRLRSRGVDAFGLIVGALALLRVAAVDRDISSLQRELWAVQGALTVTPWMILALIATAATHLAAWRFRVEEQDDDTIRRIPVVLTALSVAGWCGVWAVSAKELTITAAWLAAPIALLAFESRARRLRFMPLALIALVATAAKWTIADVAVRRLAPGFDASAVRPFVNGQMGLAVAIAAVGWWVARKLMTQSDAGAGTGGVPVSNAAGGARIAAPLPESRPWQFAILGIAAVLLVGVSFEIDASVRTLEAAGQALRFSTGQARSLLLTLAWTFGALGLTGLAVAFGRRAAGGRLHGVGLIVRAAWLVLAICAGKFLIMDTVGYALSTPSRLGLIPLPVLNLQLLAAMALGGAVIGMFVLTGLHRVAAEALQSAAGDDENRSSLAAQIAQLAAWLPVASCLLVLWGLTFEVDRAVGRYVQSFADGARPAWPAMQLRMLWVTLLWAAGGVAMLIHGKLRPWRPMLQCGWVLLLVAGMAWLSADTLAWRAALGRPVGVLPALNVQFAIGALLAGLMVFTSRFVRRDGEPLDAFASTLRGLSAAGVAAIGLWLGSLEIDRACLSGRFEIANANMVRQMCFSIFWSLYAIGLVAYGFGRRLTPARYAGLGLFGMTLLKVMIVDLSSVQQIYRVFSLLGLGLLLVATSIAYSKLSSRLLGQQTADGDGLSSTPG